MTVAELSKSAVLLELAKEEHEADVKQSNRAHLAQLDAMVKKLEDHERDGRAR